MGPEQGVVHLWVRLALVAVVLSFASLTYRRNNIGERPLALLLIGLGTFWLLYAVLRYVVDTLGLAQATVPMDAVARVVDVGGTAAFLWFLTSIIRLRRERRLTAAPGASRRQRIHGLVGERRTGEKRERRKRRS